jgi:protein TonB
MSDPKYQKRGATAGALIGVIVILGLIVFAGMWVNNARGRLLGRIDRLQTDLVAAQARIEELQGEAETANTAREDAEMRAQQAATEAAQLSDELKGAQEELGTRIHELEASVQEYEQQVAAANDARTKVETELSGQVERREALEQEIAGVRAQLEEQQALVSQLQEAAETTVAATGTARSGAGSGASGAEDSRGSAATRAARQRFADEEEPAGANVAFDTAPRPLELVPPEYPDAARREGRDGHVVVAFTVDADGRVAEVEVQESSDAEFESAALEAVRRWRFKPAMRDGEPVAVRLSQRLNFTDR